MAKLKDLFAVAPQSFIKDADIESPDQAQLEKDFAGMSFVFLRDRAPGLLPYLLGFEIVDREEDGSRAIGIFGFKLGEEYYYVPSFFVNNQVKGMDLLFSKKTNTFMPLRETWINHILDRSTLRLGQGESNKNIREDFEAPNFWWLAMPPNTPKLASDMSVTGHIQDAFATWNLMQDAVVKSMQKDADFQLAWAGAIATLKHKPLDFAKTAGGDLLIQYLQKRGGPRAVNALLRTVGTNPGFADAALAFYPSVAALAPNEFDESLAPKQGALTLVSDASLLPQDATADERQRLVRDGFSLIDRRPMEKLSELFDSSYLKQYTTPVESGRYNLLLPTGEVTQAWILPMAGNASDGTLVVVEPSKRFEFVADPARVVARGAQLEGESAYDAAVALSAMKPQERYVLVNDRGSASHPFMVRGIVAENDKRTRLSVDFDSGKDYRKEEDKEETWGRMYAPPVTCGGGIGYLQLSDDTGDSLKRIGSEIVVPSNWKALRVVNKWQYQDEAVEGMAGNTEADCKKRHDARDQAQAEFDAFTPGNIIDVEEALGKNAVHQLVVETPDKGIDYYLYVNGFSKGPLKYKQAMENLVGLYKLGVAAAENLILEAQRDIKARRLMKVAQVDGVGVGMNMPVPPGTTGVDDGTGIPIEYPFQGYNRGDFLGVPPRRDPLQPGFAVGGQSEHEVMAPDATGLAQQAGASGQKSVFDHSTISGLSKMYDSAAAVDMYLPDLMKALDRIGRILFIFYWKNEDFAERYGEEDLSELEDLVRGVFKSFGDLVLKLREKSVAGKDSGDIKAI